MCSTCGCGGDGEGRIETGTPHAHDHAHPHDHEHPHDHGDHAHPTAAEGGGATGRRVRVEQEILAKNDRYAAANRRGWETRSILALNLLSSPGSGKTTLLAATSHAFADELPVAVVEGDQQTSLDADRIRATGVSAVQINTGKGCHLDAHQVGHAVESLGVADLGLLFIENVGNLVCPAGFDLGEQARVVVLSVTEGDDKPLKYPDAFATADLVVINKIDLLPYVDFNVERCIEYTRRLRPAVETLSLSATTGDGMAGWLDWIRARRARLLAARRDALAAELAAVDGALHPGPGVAPGA